jgi:protease I
MTLQIKTIAILTANGVFQDDISNIQRALIQRRNFPKIIGAGAKLITSWDGKTWGHNFAVDVSITEALGVDYDILVVPGGEKAINALQDTAHTKRILGSFVASKRPVLFMNEAKSLINFYGLDQNSENFKVIDNVESETLAEVMEWFASAKTLPDSDELQAA